MVDVVRQGSPSGSGAIGDDPGQDEIDDEGAVEVMATTKTPVDRPRLARALVRQLGGRYSSELGIDVDAGDAEIERWFLAATLFGTRISASVAERAFHVLDRAGINRIDQAPERSWAELVELLDTAGYTRYDFRTATRLRALGDTIRDHWVAASEIGRRYTEPAELTAALDELPGWGPVTIRLFLRELRGVWPGARLPLDERAVEAGRHIGMLDPGNDDVGQLATAATRAGVDLRDLEAALVRLALRHRHQAGCPGGPSCIALPLGADASAPVHGPDR